MADTGKMSEKIHDEKIYDFIAYDRYDPDPEFRPTFIGKSGFIWNDGYYN